MASYRSGYYRVYGQVPITPLTFLNSVPIGLNSELYFMFSGADNILILWNSLAQSQLMSVEFPNLVTCLSFNYNGSKLAACSKDGITRIMNPRTGKFLNARPYFYAQIKFHVLLLEGCQNSFPVL